MSVRVMALVFDAELPDLTYTKDGEERKAKASTAKLMMLAYADHANDDGEAAYPGYTRLERKTSLSRQGIADTLDALTQNGFMTFTGKSRRNTNNYRLSLEKLAELVKPLDQPKTARVKPLDQHESSYLTSTSQVAGLNPSSNHPKHPLAADATDRPSKPKREPKPEPVTLEDRIAQFPKDVQGTITMLAEIYSWPASAIPSTPKGGKGGAYAQWIKEVRRIDQIILGHEKDALLASFQVCKSLSISHPAAITWCLPGEVGKLVREKKSMAPPLEPEKQYTLPPASLRNQALQRIGASR